MALKRILFALCLMLAPAGAFAQDANSTILGMLLMGPGLHSNDWGTKTNTNLVTLESATKGAQAIATTGGTTTLTVAQAAHAVYVVSGALTSNATVVVPSGVGVTNMFAAINSTTGAFTVTLKSGAGATVALAQGSSAFFYSDGTGIYQLGDQKGTMVPLAGGTMTGALNMGGNQINNLGAAVAAADAVNNSSTSLVPSLAVVGFDSYSCPAGWTNSATWNGVWLRGYDNGRGVDPGPVGVGGYEADQVVSHAHTGYYAYYTYAANPGGPYNSITYGGSWVQFNPIMSITPYYSGTLGSTTSAAGWTETRVRSAVVFNCQKN